MYINILNKTMRTLHLLIRFTLSFCAPIGGYDETPSGWTSNYTTTNVLNSTTDREPEEILSEGDAACEAYAITGPKTKSDCQQYELEDTDYKCCFISFSIGSYNNSISQRIAYTEAAIKDMKNAFKHAKQLSILCDGFNIKIKYLFLVVAMIFLI